MAAKLLLDGNAKGDPEDVGFKRVDLIDFGFELSAFEIAVAAAQNLQVRIEAANRLHGGHVLFGRGAIHIKSEAARGRNPRNGMEQVGGGGALGKRIFAQETRGDDEWLPIRTQKFLFGK